MLLPLLISLSLSLWSAKDMYRKKQDIIQPEIMNLYSIFFLSFFFCFKVFFTFFLFFCFSILEIHAVFICFLKFFFSNFLWMSRVPNERKTWYCPQKHYVCLPKIAFFFPFLCVFFFIIFFYLFCFLILFFKSWDTCST